MSSLRTFIVEDNPVIYENLVSTLEELTDVQVVGRALDERSATQWLQGQGTTVDLLIIDIFLLSGSGLGVLKATSWKTSSTTVQTCPKAPPRHPALCE